jgi:cleavage and polyadenylation specificity factor subunit 4
VLGGAQTVCTYWLKNLCMKGDDCGFLHQYDPARMPVCRTLIKFGECKEPDCPFKHSMDDVKVGLSLRLVPVRLGHTPLVLPCLQHFPGVLT